MVALGNFFGAIYKSALFAPLMNVLAEKFGVPATTVATYGANGVIAFGAKNLGIAVVVVIAVILALHFLAKNMKKSTKIIIDVVVAVVALAVALGVCGYQQAAQTQGLNKSGNADEWLPANQEVNEDSPIAGKTIFWLGSSVQDGFGARHNAIGDFMEVIEKTNKIKDCYSGTYIATTADEDYLPRFLLHDATTDPVVDLVVVQLGTNDSKQLTEVGDVTADDVRDYDSFDQTTTMGALEYIMKYAQETWNCPVLVYTSLWFDETKTATGMQKEAIYDEIVDKCKIACEKWDCYLLNMWDNSDAIMAVAGDMYDTYMTDSVHPTMQGYLEWWYPYFKAEIYNILAPGTEAAKEAAEAVAGSYTISAGSTTADETVEAPAA